MLYVVLCVCRAQSAMGNSEVEDPFLKLRKKIIWKAVFNKTLSVQLLKKVLLYVLFLCAVQKKKFYCIIHRIAYLIIFSVSACIIKSFKMRLYSSVQLEGCTNP